MTTSESSSEDSKQRASDKELFAILREAKQKKDIPALVTSQFNEIGEYDYSSTGLNQRLMDLHEDGIIGHQKAGNRHIWWLSSEGTTEPVELSSIEELVDYNELDPEKFTEDQAREIAEEAIPGFKKNWWQRIFASGDDPLRIGFILMFFSIAINAWSPGVIPNSILGLALIIGIVFTIIGTASFIVGWVGDNLTNWTRLPDEPWGGKNLPGFISDRVREMF